LLVVLPQAGMFTRLVAVPALSREIRVRAAPHALQRITDDVHLAAQPESLALLDGPLPRALGAIANVEWNRVPGGLSHRLEVKLVRGGDVQERADTALVAHRQLHALAHLALEARDLTRIDPKRA